MSVPAPSPLPGRTSSTRGSSDRHRVGLHHFQVGKLDDEALRLEVGRLAFAILHTQKFSCAPASICSWIAQRDLATARFSPASLRPIWRRSRGIIEVLTEQRDPDPAENDRASMSRETVCDSFQGSRPSLWSAAAWRAGACDRARGRQSDHQRHESDVDVGQNYSRGLERSSANLLQIRRVSIVFA